MALNSCFESFSNLGNSSISTLESAYFSESSGSFYSSPDALDLESSGELVISETSQVVGCRKRKNFIPQRASHLYDPSFRGVTIRMENNLSRKKRVFKPYVDSSEEEEISNNYTSSNEVISDRLWLVNKKSGNFTEKHCASCSAKKTPLWRDAEDGTPLCNACGIRYKKYRMRCATCWHIPKKDEFHPRCKSCGSSYVSPRR